jgi:[methyl-Co(III) methanol-specific corrinoid protein]:coenzyme M methyltransferase
VRKLAGHRLALMGGISNIRLLQGAPEEIAALACASAAAGIDVIGPECAIPLATPLANLKAIRCGERCGFRSAVSGADTRHLTPET